MSCPVIEVYCDSCGDKLKHMITIKPIKDVLRVTKYRCKSCGIGLNPLDFTIELEKF
jgi:uncharacterized Zn finger protein